MNDTQDEEGRVSVGMIHSIYDLFDAFLQILDQNSIFSFLLFIEFILNPHDFAQQLLLCLLQSHDPHASHLILLRRSFFHLFIILKLLQCCVKIVLQSTLFNASCTQNLAQNLCQRKIIFFLSFTIPFRIKFFPSQLDEAPRKMLVVLQDFVLVFGFYINFRQIYIFGMKLMQDFQKIVAC